MYGVGILANKVFVMCYEYIYIIVHVYYRMTCIMVDYQTLRHASSRRFALKTQVVAVDSPRT